MPFSPDLLYGLLQENSLAAPLKFKVYCVFTTKNNYISDINGNNAVQGYKNK